MSSPERYHWRRMVAKLEQLVERVSSELSVALSAQALRSLGTWLERLQEWNARIDLTAARTPEELVDLMLADALVLAAHVPRGARVVDVGTGAGAPGLPLGVVREDLHVTLVEPLGKRVSFLRTVLGAVGRMDVGLERGRGETFAGRQSFDVAISRATLPPPAWLSLGTDLVVPGGCVWALLANDAPPSPPRAVLAEQHAYTWPLTGAKRLAVAYRVSG